MSVLRVVRDGWWQMTSKEYIPMDPVESKDPRVQTEPTVTAKAEDVTIFGMIYLEKYKSVGSWSASMLARALDKSDLARKVAEDRIIEQNGKLNNIRNTLSSSIAFFTKPKDVTTGYGLRQLVCPECDGRGGWQFDPSAGNDGWTSALGECPDDWCTKCYGVGSVLTHTIEGEK